MLQQILLPDFLPLVSLVGGVLIALDSPLDFQKKLVFDLSYL